MKENAWIGQSYLKQLSQPPNSGQIYNQLFTVKQLHFSFPSTALVWLEQQRPDSRSMLWHSNGRILCSSPLSPHRQQFRPVINTEPSQKAARLVKGEWQFLSKNLYTLINTFKPESLKIWEACRLGAEGFIGQVVSKCWCLSVRP